MYTTRLDKLDATVSRLGFGAMRLPTLEDGTIDRQRTSEMVDLAYKNGVNYFDTAYNYHGGKSQTVLSSILRSYPRDSYYLVNKLPLWVCKTREDCAGIFQEQLDICGVDHFDFYLLHSMDRGRLEQCRALDALSLLDGYKRSGKIRRLGFSFHGDYDTFLELLELYPWDFVQIQLNYIDQEVMGSGRLYDELKRRSIPCMVMEPVRGGFLANLPEESAALFRGHNGGRYSCAQWALRWCMDRDNAAVILSGMTTLEQVRENVAVFSSAPPLSTEDSDVIARVQKQLLSAKVIPCTACNYCAVCPSEVDIPEIFNQYNQLQMFAGSGLRVKYIYASLGREHDARACTGCGTCLEICPQGIQIPEMLSKAHRAVKEIPIEMPSDKVIGD